ncbi:MAG: hypothetical protein AB4038_13620 [Prochloraceae cyanobacterium]
MIVDFIEDLKRYQKFRPESSCFSSSLLTTLDKQRAKAIAQKSLREGCSVNLVIEKLLEDSHFKKVTNKLGKEKSLKLISETVKMAVQQELRRRELELSETLVKNRVSSAFVFKP